ncbi:MAG: hypothetical protein ACRDS0_17615 [Pseudonocardiaceae bacterium]
MIYYAPGGSTAAAAATTLLVGLPVESDSSHVSLDDPHRDRRSRPSSPHTFRALRRHAPLAGRLHGHPHSTDVPGQQEVVGRNHRDPTTTADAAITGTASAPRGARVKPGAASMHLPTAVHSR